MSATMLALLLIACAACAAQAPLAPSRATPERCAMRLNCAASGSGMRGDPTLLRFDEVRNLIVLICFADEDPAEAFDEKTRKAIEENLNSENAPSLKDYYSRLSGGEFTVNSLLLRDSDALFVYRDKRDRAFFRKIGDEKDRSRYAEESDLLNRAAEACNAAFRDSGESEESLDKNGDGAVDCASFVVSGSYDPAKDWGRLLWPHAWDLDLITKQASPAASSARIGSKAVGRYIFTFAQGFEIGLIAHEFGHIVGLPDYYHYDHDKNDLPVGYWDLMHKHCSIPQFMTTYSREKYLGFVNGARISELERNGTYKLKPTASASPDETLAYRITLNENEQVYLEYRAFVPPYDSQLRTHGLVPGLLAYRANRSAHGNEKSRRNSSTRPDELYVYRPESSRGSDGDLARLRLAPIVFKDGLKKMLREDPPGGCRETLGKKDASGGKYADGAIFDSSGRNTGITIRATAQTEDEITFDVDLGRYDCDNIKEMFVRGRDLKGLIAPRNEHCARLGEDPAKGLSVMILYENRPTPFELNRFELECDPNKVGTQVAKARFSVAGEPKEIEFRLRIEGFTSDVAELVRGPTKCRIKPGEELDLAGLKIRIDCGSGARIEKEYDESEKEKWEIAEGLNTAESGVYDRVLAIYDKRVRCILPPITVSGEIFELFADETDSRHIRGSRFAEEFRVFGRFDGADGPVRALDESEIEIKRISDEEPADPFDVPRTKISISSLTDPSKKAETYEYSVGNATVVEIGSVDSLAPYLKFGQFPSVPEECMVRDIRLSDGRRIPALPLRNYSSELTERFAAKRQGRQELVSALGSDAPDGAKISLFVDVLPKTGALLRAKSDAAQVLKAPKAAIASEPMTLAELSAHLESYLDMRFFNVGHGADDYELPLSAFGARPAGRSAEIRLCSEGTVVDAYRVLLLGDENGDGAITAEDREGWIDDLFSDEEDASQFADRFLDVTGDGRYDLADFARLNAMAERDA